ncbi:hypothetical protein AMAG_04027 [Allomyces macrogynus ATCC 38327]|nr:hypothetical protein AMAG_04027 [Allomyces macrogynus ATCC 38327]|eukprot:KNE58456.1 hypothetical protein AMAG_04027 [Allomyces macrogynus ATCC 38327]
MLIQIIYLVTLFYALTEGDFGGPGMYTNITLCRFAATLEAFTLYYVSIPMTKHLVKRQSASGGGGAGAGTRGSSRGGAGSQVESSGGGGVRSRASSTAPTDASRRELVKPESAAVAGGVTATARVAA